MREADDSLDAQVERHVGGLTFRGTSRAGLCTSVLVRELRLLLDAGTCTGSTIHCDAVLVSHEHPDHFIALPQILTMRRLLGHKELLIACPSTSADAIAAFLEAGQLASARARWRYRLVGMEPGDSLDLGRDRSATAWRVDHTVESLGYVVYEHRRRLLPELEGLPGSELGARRKRGESVDEEVKVPMLAVSGDTTAGALAGHPDVARARVLLTECTFLAPEHAARAAATQHVHLPELLTMLDRFENEAILLYHISLRYSRAQVLRVLDEAVPPAARERLEVFL